MEWRNLVVLRLGKLILIAWISSGMICGSKGVNGRCVLPMLAVRNVCWRQQPYSGQREQVNEARHALFFRPLPAEWNGPMGLVRAQANKPEADLAGSDQPALLHIDYFS